MPKSSALRLVGTEEARGPFSVRRVVTSTPGESFPWGPTIALVLGLVGYVVLITIGVLTAQSFLAR